MVVTAQKRWTTLAEQWMHVLVNEMFIDNMTLCDALVGDSSLIYILNDEQLTVPPDALTGDYAITPNGSADSWNALWPCMTPITMTSAGCAMRRLPRASLAFAEIGARLLLISFSSALV